MGRGQSAWHAQGMRTQGAAATRGAVPPVRSRGIRQLGALPCDRFLRRNQLTAVPKELGELKLLVML